MRSRSQLWRAEVGWLGPAQPRQFRADLILAFGSGRMLAESSALHDLQVANSHAVIASISTAGEISGESVFDDTIVTLAIEFKSTKVRGHLVALRAGETSDQVAERLVTEIATEQLAHVIVFSDGLHVNGSALASGLSARLPAHVAVTGGMAADGDRFGHTYVGLGACVAEKQIVAVALYGDALRIGFGSAGGWTAFGPERIITRSSGNVMHTLDGEPALALYKRYLGDAAGELPASALLFPLAVNRSDSTAPLVRTILAVDEAQGTLTFAGDVPEGARVRLMRATFDSLVGGAESAARAAVDKLGCAPSVAMLVSCVGRRLVLKQRVEDELDGVRQILGNTSVMAGLYSYGEITPLEPGCCSELHNQTMTVTTFAEC